MSSETVSTPVPLHEGDPIPDVELQVIEQGFAQRRRSAELFADHTVVLFALPGAFTPTCSSLHLPRYEELAPLLRQQGVDRLICLSVNDPFVMTEWGRDQGVKEVLLVADGNAEFTEAMGLLVDDREQSMGQRSRRYSMLVKQGRIARMFIEADETGDPYGASSAETMLSHLAPEKTPPPQVALISKAGCPHCARARRLLDEQGLRYTDISLPDATRARALAAITGEVTAPQMFIDGQRIGGADALARELARRSGSRQEAAQTPVATGRG